MEDDLARQMLLSDIPLWTWGLLVFLVILSAFFSSAETAFSSANIVKLKSYVEEGKSRAKKALYVIDHFDKTITAILIGNNIVNIAIATIGATVLLQLLGDPTIANLVNTAGITTIILIFGELLPKSTAKANADDLAYLYGPTMYFLVQAFTPFIWLLKPFNTPRSRVKQEEKSMYSDAELETLIEHLEEEGSLGEERADMIQSVLDLDNTMVEDIMTPRVDCVMIDVEEPIEKLEQLFIDTGYTRIPVYQDDKDKVIGKVHFKDMMQVMLENKKGKKHIRDYITDVVYVPETLTVDKLITELQRNQQHLAVVTGEYGGTAGIVTMEDALEELVGEIFDEHDEEISEFVKITDTHFIIHGDYSLDDLFDELDLAVPESEYSSVGGFLQAQLSTYPEIGEVVTVVIKEAAEDMNRDFIEYVLEFKVRDVVDRRIISVELNMHEKEELES
jgi:CBS domain containing-hemolysin-like protein